MKQLTVLAVLSICLASSPTALAGEKTPLWPEGRIPDFQPQQVAIPLETQRALGKDFKAEEHRMPYLEWSDAPGTNATRACVILISGGGYGSTCDGPAFRPLERELLKAGVHCVWLWYRTPRPKGLPIYRSAWADGQRAVRLVRAEAAKRGYDPEMIGVLGCSAGSHLSVLLGTSALTPAYEPVDDLDATPCHINWAIPMCPAYVLDDGLKGSNRNRGVGAKLSDVFKFDAKTCPMCFFHGEDDPYSPLGSTALYAKLRSMKVPAEVHLDAGRGHGPVPASMFGRAVEFMRQMGWLGKNGREEALMQRFATDADRVSVERQDVWPAGGMPNASTNQCVPYVEWHLPKTLKTKAIQVIYSGGCYNHSAPDDFEVAPARRYLNARGMTVVTLKYRVPRPVGLPFYQSAWQDLQRTVRLVRSQAEARGLDPNRIGVMGSSAGGHLALMGAFSSQTNAYARIDAIDDLSCAVQWGVGIYPAYILRPENDSGVIAKEFAFDKGTCPMVFVHGDQDPYPSMASVRCWEKLREMGIPSDLHTLALRKHCFQRAAAPGTGSYTWLDRIGEFLDRRSFVK